MWGRGILSLPPGAEDEAHEGETDNVVTRIDEHVGPAFHFKESGDKGGHGYPAESRQETVKGTVASGDGIQPAIFWGILQKHSKVCCHDK